MSPKVAKKAAAPAPAAKGKAAAGKPGKGAPAEAAGKKGKKAAAAAEPGKVALGPDGQPLVSAEELEEQAEAAEEAAARSGGGGGEAAALAAAGSTEMSASFKNFRHHPDMENFYRFIYENDLRHEALAIIDVIQNEKALKRAAKSKH